MATFISQVENYTGTFSDTGAVDGWLTAAASSIIDRLNPSKLEKYAQDVDITANGLSLQDYRVFGIRKSGTKARYVDGNMKAQAIDSDSIHYALTLDPVFFNEAGKVYLYAEGIATTGTAYALAYPTVANTESAVANFPDELEQALVLYAAEHACLDKMGAETVVMNALSLGAVTANINGVAWATAYPNQYTTIATALSALATEIGECPAIADKIDAEIALANTEIDNSATAVGTAVSTALTAVTTAAGRINAAVLLANTEYDKISAIVDLANVEFDKIAAEIASGDSTITDGSDIDKGLAQLQTATTYASGGSTYLSEAQTRINNGNAYLSEAQADLTEARAYIGKLVRGSNKYKDMVR